MSDATYNDYFTYLRAGAYGLEGFFNNLGDPQQYSYDWRGQYKPVVWLRYPGESVTVDHNLAPGSIHPSFPPDSNGAFIDFRDGNSNDAFIYGIVFRDMRNHSFRLTNNRAVFFDNRFQNLGPGLNGANSSFIEFSGRELHASEYMFVRDNVFDTLNVGAFIKTYGLWHSVIENNRFLNPTGTPLEGIALKHADHYVDVRRNTLDGNFGKGAINGNWNYDGNLEIRFNLILNSPRTYGAGIGNAINMNHDGLANGPVYVYRNTFDGNVALRAGVTGNGPITFSQNVIVNENSGTPPGSHLSFESVAEPSILISRENLVGYPADNIIDVNGNLTPAYSQYIGVRGHQLGARSVAPGAPIGFRVF